MAMTQRRALLARFCAPAFAAVVLAIAAHTGRAPAAGTDSPTNISVGQSYEQRYWVEELVNDLEFPWAMTWLPNADLLVTERLGKIRIIRDGRQSSQITGLPDLLTKGPYNGLLDIKIDPDFSVSHRVFLTFMAGTESAREGVVYRARVDGTRLVDGQIIFRAKPPRTPGGPNIMRILFLPDRTMLIGVGSGNQGSAALVQRLDNHVGKVVRINRDGSAPSDNPFVATPGALPEVWASGLRNPSGIARMQDGSLWSVDIGPFGGDELNLMRAAGNYGWPNDSWGFDYTGRAMSQSHASADFTAPELVWSPTITPSGLVQYTGNTFPFWNGDLFTGGLSGQSLRRIRIRDGHVVLQERLLADLNERIRSVEIGPDNLIYLITDASRGRLLRLRPGMPSGADHDRVARRRETPAGESGLNLHDPATKAILEFKYDPVRGRELYGQYCAACHSFGDFRDGEIGPSLDGVIGRPPGRLPGYSYSSALRSADPKIIWDTRTLMTFIAAPQAYYPGTKMVAPPVTDFVEGMQIAAFLEREAGAAAAAHPAERR